MSGRGHGERGLRVALTLLDAIGLVAIVALLLTVGGVAPRTVTVGDATYDLLWVCVAAIAIDAALAAPLRLILRSGGDG